MPSKKSAPTLHDDLMAIKKKQGDALRDRRRLSDAPIRQRKLLLAAVGLGLVVLIGLCCSAAKTMDLEKFVEIAALLQPAWLSRPAVVNARSSVLTEVAQLHEPVMSGDTIRTGEGGGAHLEFPDQTMIKLGPLTTFYVRYNSYSKRTGGRRRGFFLWGGRVWCRVSKFVSGESDFTIDTPTAVAGVRGTRFSVMVYHNTGNPNLPDGATYISVEDGEVRVAAKGVPQHTLLKAGQEATVFPAMRTPPVPRLISPAESGVWQSQATGRLGTLGNVLADPTDPTKFKVMDFEEQIVGRPLALVASMAHIDSLSGEKEDESLPMATANMPGGGGAASFSDKAAYVKAQTAARALQIAMENSYDAANGYPETIGLSDLTNVNISHDRIGVILGNIDEGRIQKYQRLRGKYILDIRAKQPSGVLIEITPDSIKTMGDVNLDKP